MNKILLNKIYLLAFLCYIGSYQIYAQDDYEYTFDGTTWEGWGPQGGTGAYVSVFANSNPNDALNISWPNVGANTKNIVMYANNDLATLDLDTNNYKYIQVQVTNTSSEVNRMNIRTRSTEAGNTSWTVVHSEEITTDASGTIRTYDFEITHANYSGTLDRFQIVFKKDDNSVLSANTNTDAILVHNIVVSTSNTLSNKDFSKIDFNIYPNPVEDVLTIDSNEAIHQVDIYDVLGKQVMTTINNTNQIDVSDLEKAIYVVRITSEKGVSSKKFVKQ